MLFFSEHLPVYHDIGDARPDGEHGGDAEGDDADPVGHALRRTDPETARAREQHGDGDILKSRFDLADHIGGEDEPRRRRDHAEPADDEFAREDDRHADARIYHHPFALPEHFERFGSGKKEDKCGGNENLVRNGIEKFSEVGDQPALTGDVTVEKVGTRGYDENEAGDEIILRDRLHKEKDGKHRDEQDACERDLIRQIHT